MELNFNTEITIYEIIAIGLSILSLIIPGIIWIVKKLFINAKLEIYPTNQLKLLYNESGSYINLDFSIECKYKNVVIQNIETTIIRKDDGKKLELIQSIFKSPIYSSIGSNYLSSNETAHPFKIEVNGLQNIFLEESNKNAETIKKLSEIHNYKLKDFTTSNNYDSDIIKFKNKENYNTMYAKLYEELFWKNGKYMMHLVVKYNKNKELIKKYYFEIDEKEAELFEKNVEEALLCRLKKIYQIQTNFYLGNKNYVEMK